MIKRLDSSITKHKTKTIKFSDFFDYDLFRFDQPCLVIISGHEIGRRFLINRSEMIIGRSNECHIILKEKDISRRHARIIKSEHNNEYDIIIEDLKSKNDTYVNGKKINLCKLKEGDLIVIGTIIFKFSIQSVLDKKFSEEVYQAKYDELTGLMNRRFFKRYMILEFSRAKRYNHDISLLICDLDDFKKVNDLYGHLAGDKTLSIVGQIIVSCIRQDVDIPVRYGGEEFIILLPQTSLHSAKTVAEKIRKSIEDLRINYGQNIIKITMSIGISSKSEGLFNPLELILKADEKLYLAKEQGKNRIKI